MTVNRSLKGLYVITDHNIPDFKTLYHRTEEILSMGIAVLQYRDKRDDKEGDYDRASQLQKLCLKYDTYFIINDDINLARQLGSDGIHLGKDDIACNAARNVLGKNKLIGVSCYNSLQRAEHAVSEGADYIAFGAMYPTSSKSNTEHATPELITDAKEKYKIPVAAIGGITPGNCLPLLEAGVDMLATISSVYQAQNPGSVVNEFNRLMTKKIK